LIVASHLCSFSALGADAVALIAPQQPVDVYAPLMTLAHRNGYVLLIGVDLDKLTLLHVAEKAAGRRLFRRWANDRAGRASAVEVGSCSAGFPQLAAELHALIQTIMVGQSTWQLLPARATLERGTATKNRDIVEQRRRGAECHTGTQHVWACCAIYSSASIGIAAHAADAVIVLGN
jgi:aminoglycoside N3'-acetyltransferase